jgi:predicted transcriptional regulator
VATTLETIRKTFKPPVTQEEVARGADLPLSTYRNAEKGKNVSYTTAKAIFIAVNKIKEKRGEMQLERIEDLGLSIV